MPFANSHTLALMVVHNKDVAFDVVMFNFRDQKIMRLANIMGSTRLGLNMKLYGVLYYIWLRRDNVYIMKLYVGIYNHWIEN